MTSDHIDLVFTKIDTMLRNAHDEGSPLAAAQALYNEGWLLRLFLSFAPNGGHGLPRFLPDSRWFSEPLMYSRFLARGQGDKFSERHTHADAAVGQLRFVDGSKRGLKLQPGARQFITIEAKMNSSLAAGIRNISDYDQATRYVACMAETISRAEIPVSSFESLAFIVICPKAFAEAHKPLLNPAEMNRKVADRISRYPETRAEDLENWKRAWFDPLLAKLEMSIVTWEEVIKGISAETPDVGKALEVFYSRCTTFNTPKLKPRIRSETPFVSSFSPRSGSGVSMVRLKREFAEQFPSFNAGDTFVYFSWTVATDGARLRNYATLPRMDFPDLTSLSEIEKYIDPAHETAPISREEREKFSDDRFWHEKTIELNNETNDRSVHE